MKIKIYLILLLAFTSRKSLRAQAPVISYAGSQVYIIGKTVNSVAPNNTGGAVPLRTYGQVTAFAGSGSRGNANGTAAAASFSGPSGEAVDASGNIYVADATNNLIRKITPQGVVSTFAGNGTAGSANGNALSASFNQPFGIAIDANNNLFVVDEGNNLIRKITASGLVSTLAGSGAAGFSNGPAAVASFNDPQGIAVDASGNVYVSDSDNNAIRKITSAGVVSTLAGGNRSTKDGQGTAAGFYGPTGIGVDAAGNIYVADQYNNLIRKITPGGLVTTIAGNSSSPLPVDGIGTAARFDSPFGLCLDAIGNIYVSDSSNPQIRVITPAGVVSTVAGLGSTTTPIISIINGTGAAATFLAPYGLAIDQQGHLFVTEHYANLVREVSVYGYSISPLLPPGLNFDATTGTITGTPSVARTIENYTVGAFNPAGSSAATFAITVNAAQLPLISYPGKRIVITGAAIVPIAPANSGGAVPPNLYGEVSTFAGSGVTGSANGPVSSASFNEPYGIAIDPGGNVYISDVSSNLIRKITPAGVVSTFAGSGSAGAANGSGQAASFNQPVGMTTDASGNLFVVDRRNNLIRKITPSGIVSTFAGNGQAYFTDGQGTSASFNNPSGIHIDRAGNFYVTDNANKSIRKITAGGLVSTLTTGLVDPEDVVPDNDGNLFEADILTINKINSAGTATNFAGNGVQGTTDGLEQAARFGGLVGITIDAGNNLYVTDADDNEAIRKITPSGLVSTLAGRAYFTFQTLINGQGATAVFGTPQSITIDPSGNLLVIDKGFHVIRKVTTTGYIISPALPMGLSMDGTGTISGTPAAPSPATTYTVTAYNAGGSSTTTLNIAIVADSGKAIAQTITFPALNNTIYGALPITPAALASSDLPISYSSSDVNVATILNGQIHVVGAGTATITATQAGTAVYNAAAAQSQVLTVAQAPLVIKPNNQSKYFTDANPQLTFTCSGLVNNDIPGSLTVQPVLTTLAGNFSAPGTYPINAAGAASANYTISYQPGTLTVNPAPTAVISAVTPATAIAGTIVMISGTYLYGATAVNFGGKAASSFSVVSPDSITATVTGGAGNNITVTTPSGTVSFSGFTFVPVPAVYAQGPVEIQTGGSVMLTTALLQGYSYQWLRDGVPINGATSADYTATQSGAYTVQLTVNGLTQTSPATNVNIVFNLPPNNFTLVNTSETCRGAADGTIHITAAQNLSYTATINNVAYNFTDSLTVGNLAAGNYDVCFTVAGQTAYQQCFTSVITQPQDLSVYAAVSAKTNQVILSLAGASRYIIKLNGVTSITTENQLTLNLKDGTNTIEVTTDRLCQGDIVKTITIASLVPYPNPFSGTLNIDIGTVPVKNTIATVYDLNNKMVYTSSFSNQTGAIQLELSGLNPGLYVLKLSTDNKETISKVEKK